jgi:hypothetical protein
MTKKKTARGPMRRCGDALAHSADSITELWNRLPSEREPRTSDPIVLAIFASAGGLSIAAALTLVLVTPR